MTELTSEQKDRKINVLLSQLSHLQGAILDYQIRDAAPPVDSSEE